MREAHGPTKAEAPSSHTYGNQSARAWCIWVARIIAFMVLFFQALCTVEVLRDQQGREYS